jgi:hypothetical protein
MSNLFLSRTRSGPIELITYFANSFPLRIDNFQYETDVIEIEIDKYTPFLTTYNYTDLHSVLWTT